MESWGKISGLSSTESFIKLSDLIYQTVWSQNLILPIKVLTKKRKYKGKNDTFKAVDLSLLQFHLPYT